MMYEGQKTDLDDGLCTGRTRLGVATHSLAASTKQKESP